MKYNKNSEEAVKEWLEIKNEEKINEKVQIKNNLVEWLCHDAYNNKQQILYLEDKKEVRLFEITGIKKIEIERALKNILEKYDNIILKGAYDIENCQTIEHAIRLLNKTPVVGKQDHRSLKEHEWIEK